MKMIEPALSSTDPLIKFCCRKCGPTNAFMGITTLGVEERFCIKCDPGKAQFAAQLPRTSPT